MSICCIRHLKNRLVTELKTYVLMANSLSSFVDPGPHGNGRYSEHMLPEVEKKDFRKGSQVYSACVLP